MCNKIETDIPINTISDSIYLGEFSDILGKINQNCKIIAQTPYSTNTITIHGYETDMGEVADDIIEIFSNVQYHNIWVGQSMWETRANVGHLTIDQLIEQYEILYTKIKP